MLLSSNRNMSGSLEERGMLWEHEPQTIREKIKELLVWKIESAIPRLTAGKSMFFKFYREKPSL